MAGRKGQSATYRRTRGIGKGGEKERSSQYSNLYPNVQQMERTFFIIPAFLLLNVMCRLLLSWMNSILIFRRPALVESAAEERRAVETERGASVHLRAEKEKKVCCENVRVSSSSSSSPSPSPCSIAKPPLSATWLPRSGPPAWGGAPPLVS